MSSEFVVPAERGEMALLIAFIDVMGYALQASRVTDDESAEVIDGYYRLVAESVAAAGGKAVKFMGDGALVVFDARSADRGIQALLDAKLAVDRYFEARGWDCRATIKAHVGTAIAGAFGPASDARFDVIGKAVNAAAMLDASGVALSVEAFRALTPETRQRFKKHTWPVTYIRVEDPHRFRRR